jgi:hypothetical protein
MCIASENHDRIYINVALEGKNAYKMLVRKHEGIRSLGRPRDKCEGNIKTVNRMGEWIGFIWFRIKTNGGFLRAR